jgi:membrane-associated phospholipid phosphatase
MNMPSGPAIPWHHQLYARFKRHFLLKFFGTPLFLLAFFAGYIYLLHHPFFPVTEMPLTRLDKLIGFQPQALILYVSLWFYVSIPPALQPTRGELFYYGWAVGALCVTGLACFLLWPTAVPATHIDWENAMGFALLKGVDAAGNACPSLHVASAVFSAAWLNRQLADAGAPRFVRMLNWAWCTGIAYSTLATKQHVAVDLYAGAALGLFAAYLSLNLMPLQFRQARISAEAKQRLAK